MPTKIKLEDGTEVDALTPAEVQAKLNEKEAEVNKVWVDKNTEVQTQLTKLQTEKKDLEAKIAAGGGPQAENFKTLKEAMDKKDADIVALNKKIDDDKVARVNEYRDTVVKKMSGTDKELEKKILLHFNETLRGMPAATQEEITKKLESALKLSVDNMSPSVLAAAMGGGGPGLPQNQGGAVEFSATEKALGAKLGISEEDYKKYGPKLKTIKK